MNTAIKLINETPKHKVELRLTLNGVKCLGSALGLIEDKQFNEDELVSAILRSCTREVYKLLEEKHFKIIHADQVDEKKTYKVKLKAQYACTLLYVLMYVILDWSHLDEYTKAVFREVIDTINKTL